MFEDPKIAGNIFETFDRFVDGVVIFCIFKVVGRQGRSQVALPPPLSFPPISRRKNERGGIKKGVFIVKILWGSLGCCTVLVPRKCTPPPPPVEL